MKLYSDYGARRTRQIIADVLAIALIGLWIWFGITVFQLVENLAGFGVQMEEAGAGFKQTMTDVGESLGDVPLIGDGIRIPFDNASEAGAALEAAGQSQQDAVLQLAIGLGVGVAVLPVLMILLIWLVPRIRFIRRAGRAKAVVAGEAGLDLLALRALVTQRMSAVTSVAPDAVAAWKRGDADVVRRLAGLELRSAGVRLGDEYPESAPD